MRTTVLVRRQHRRDKIEAAQGCGRGRRQGGRAQRAGCERGRSGGGGSGCRQDRQVGGGGHCGGCGKGSGPAGAGCGGGSLADRFCVGACECPALDAARVAHSGCDSCLGERGFRSAGLAIRDGRGCGHAWRGGTGGRPGLALAAGVFEFVGSAKTNGLLRTERVVVAVDRAGSLLPVGAAAAFAAVALWFAVPAAGRWFETAGPSPGPSPAAKAPAARDDVIQGTGRVAGPGLVRIGSNSVRLNGVTMLDFSQVCRRADGSTWTCGAAAEKSFDKLIRSRRQLRCEITGEADGIRNGTCELDGKDLAAELVRQGFAFAEGSLWSSYSAQQSEAQEAKAGLWAGEPERPDAWRDRLFADAAAGAPGGCPIKGRIQSGRRTYLLPHSADYPRISIREERGDRWFCSAEEAEAAGFQARDAKR